MIVEEFLNGRKIDDLINQLLKKNVKVLLDIRASTRFPQYFAPTNLDAICKEREIIYIYLQKLGNPFLLRSLSKKILLQIKSRKKNLDSFFLQEQLNKGGVKTTIFESLINREITDLKNQVILKHYVAPDTFNKINESMTEPDIAKLFYQHYVINNNLLNPINKIIQENADKTICFICYCQTNVDCHRFWLMELIKNQGAPN